MWRRLKVKPGRLASRVDAAASIVPTDASGQKEALAAAAPKTTASGWRRLTARIRTSMLYA
jgi:hypothetical protein